MLHTYYEYRDHYAVNTRDIRPKPSWREFFRAIMAETLVMAQTEPRSRPQFNHLAAEETWYLAGRPYYNLHPSMINILEGLDLPDLPADSIRFPYKSFAVHFPVGEQSLMVGKDHMLQSAMCYMPDREHVQPVEALQQILQGKPPPVMTRNLERNQIIIFMDFNEGTPGVPGKLFTFKNLEWEHGDTLEQAYNKLPILPSYNWGIQIPDDLQRLAVRLVLSVGFLAQEKNVLIQPHYLSKHLNQVEGASPEKLKELAKKATEVRGKKGFMVGDDRFLPVSKRLGTIASMGPHEETGRKLKWQHVVGIHWKTVRFGPNHSQSEVRLIMPYTRGKDLPFKPS